jgi:hypothetical protein
MRFGLRFAIGMLALAVPAVAGDLEQRQKLAGSWQESGAAPKTWILEETGDNVRITETANGQKLVEYECNTLGKECEVKESGKHAKVSMWFNGPRLVAMEVRGNDVVKRRFQASEDGAGMKIEVIPIAPAGKPEVIELKRLTTAAASQ